MCRRFLTALFLALLTALPARAGTAGIAAGTGATRAAINKLRLTHTDVAAPITFFMGTLPVPPVSAAAAAAHLDNPTATMTPVHTYEQPSDTFQMLAREVRNRSWLNAWPVFYPRPCTMELPTWGAGRETHDDDDDDSDSDD